MNPNTNMPLNTQMNNQNEKSLRDYISLFRLNFTAIFLISFTGLLVAIVYAVTAPNVYKSNTELKIAKSTGNILQGSMLPEFEGLNQDRFVMNEIEILKSYRVRSRVAQMLIDSSQLNSFRNKYSLMLTEQFGIDKKDYRLKSVENIASVLKNVTIEQKRGLDIVDLSVESTSPVEAALIANCYAKAYRETNLSYSREQYTIIKNFLAQQRDEKLSGLDRTEETLKNYQEQKGIVQLDEQAKALIGQSSDMQAKMNATKIDLTISEKNLNQYKEELKKRSPDLTNYIENFATEPYIKKLQEQIADYKTQRDRYLSSPNTNSQKVLQDFDNKINDLHSKLDNQLSVYKAGILASTPDEIKNLTRQVIEEEIKYQSNLASYKKMNEILGDYDRKMNQLPTSAIDLARLQREQSSNEKLYLLVEERYQEAVINEQSVPGNVLIIDDGLVPGSPSKPNRILIVIVGLVLGITMGVGFAVVRNFLDNTVKTPEDLQKRGINVLAWIPQIEGVAANNDLEFIVAKKPDASASEAYRALRTRIKFSKLDKEGAGIKTLLVTSATSQEGKTTTSINIAGTLAQANFRTLLLDADLRKPRIHNVFKQKRFPGFTDYFFGQASYEDIIRKSEVNNLDFITAGTIPPNPSEILGSVQMESFLNKLKNDYDYVIVDSPPVVAVTDSEIISSLVDGTILVVSANNTEMELMEKAISLLNHEQSSLIGVILNNFNYKSGYGSYYKYYYYYSRDASKKNSRDKV
jgi:tyrosine-protein kinase Etk/Wzc